MGIWRETWESTIHRLRRPLQKRIVVHRFCKFGVSAVLILRKTITSSYKKVVEIGSTSGMRVQSFGPSSVKMWREFPNHSAVNLQTTRAVSRISCRVVRQPIPDSQVSRQKSSNIRAIYQPQVCSNCGTIHKKSLEEWWHSCECGCELDRDTNAAINILRVGRTQRLTA